MSSDETGSAPTAPRRWLLLTAALAACGAPDLDPPAADAPTWWQDARPIVAARCATCHREGDIAPFPLVTLGDVRAHAGLVRIAVDLETMPPWPAADDCAEYENDRSLTEEEKATLLAWLDADTPEGEPIDETTEPSPTDGFDADVTLALPEPYTPTIAPDDYRCQLIPWPEATERYITGLAVTPDRRDLVHHVIVYAADGDTLADVAARDEAEEGPGYTCYGGPNGTSSADAFDPTREPPRWVGSWVPGTSASMLPEGTGIRMSPGDHLIVQVHYNTSSATPGPDQSSVAFTLADEVEHPAAVMPLADPGWVTDGALGPAMTIPAGDPEVTHSADLPLLKSPVFLAGAGAEIGYTPGGSVRVHNAALHMHTLGRAGHVGVNHADGTSSCILDIERWDFHWQGAYRLAEPVVVGADDTFELSCTWDNGDGDEDVSWGEGTDDEMCLAVVYLTAE